MFKSLIRYSVVILTAIVFFSSCKKEDEIITDASARIEFSQDTIFFDTVFVQTGSATQVFLVYNNNDKAVNISSLHLGAGNSSYYRLNVNGTPGKTFNNVFIGAKDSIYIFVEVTIPDPNNPNTPFVVSDSILFDLNGNEQKVMLQSWGQRAHFHHAPANTGSLFFLNCNETWTNDLPHVVYGYALVDSGCTLTIAEGTKVYFHPHSGIIVLSNATLKVNGTQPDPVTFQGDRLGYNFDNEAGQWDRIWLSNLTHSNLVNGTNEIGSGAKNCSIDYAVIKNGNIGLQVDTVNTPGTTSLSLNNTIVKNMAGVALLAQGSSVKANNCIFANSGQYLAALLYGGNHRFLHCTFANYWSGGNRQTPSILINNYYNNGIRKIDSAYFGNCIVYGAADNEIGLDSTSSGTLADYNYRFDHCLLKVDNTIPTGSTLRFNSVITGYSPLFKDISNNIYEIDSTSMAVDAGAISITNLSPVLNFDLKGNARPQGINPDLGAYERR
ncbi:MAG: hypothetical protein NT126_10190 [Bacteroidetes bacterium]|nr:hypothetical protein [Bacteroidota bacterium]